jgi:hypothetical protein
MTRVVGVEKDVNSARQLLGTHPELQNLVTLQKYWPLKHRPITGLD